MTSELKRKTVHITMVGFALLIGRVPPVIISLLCLVALLFNIYLLPRLTGKGLERREDLARGFSLGMVAYPAILLLISLLFFRAQVYLAIAWGAMAFGDGFAGLVGAAFKGPKLPWNQSKSVAGTISFILLGSLGSLGLLFLLPESALLGHSLDAWLIPVVCAMVAAALLESVPGLVDDNLVVPLVAAVVSMIVMLCAWPVLPGNWAVGLGFVVLLAGLSIGSGKIDVPGGLVGSILAWFIFLGAGLWGLLLLGMFFALGSLASHWKKEAKEKLGVAQENKGKRGVRNALANGAVAAFCGLLAWLFPQQAPLWTVALAASLASATADTTSSELGTVYGRRFVNVLTFKPDTRGLDGVISLEGSLFGFVGGLAIALCYGAGPGSLSAVLIITSAGVLGNYVDSLLGASLQRRDYMTNETVNLANTAFAGFVGALFSGWVPVF